MIAYRTGNLLEADVTALVNTVNTVGVMGKGIALQFKNAYPHNFKIYQAACKAKTFQTGELLIVEENQIGGSKLIINFPTKAHWRANSKYEYIDAGLEALRAEIINRNIDSIAIPPLGCGNGGLDWNIVQAKIEQRLSDLACNIIVYEPNQRIKEELQKEATSKPAKLTPARAMFLDLLYDYERSGEQASLFVANKLAYFLQRSGEKLKLQFEGYIYGPYSHQINHVLQYLNGVYIKGLEQNSARPFDPILLVYDKESAVQTYIASNLSDEQVNRIKSVKRLIDGFESTYSLEILSSVDFILSKDRHQTMDEILKQLGTWSARKKAFPEQQVRVAYDHLRSFEQSLFIA